VLELLPPPDDRLSAEVQQRLGRIRQRLQQAAADASTSTSIITLRADAMPLSETLRAFQEQSGNRIVDYRRQFGQPESDPKLKVDFQKTPFWPALDQLLEQAGLMFYPYGQPRAVSVVSASGKKKTGTSRTCYNGPFRFEPVSVVARHDMRQPESRSLVVTLEAAWEPRLRIINLVHRMADVRAVDDRGEPLPVADPAAQPEVPTTGAASAVKLDLPLQLPPREVKQIAHLKGKLLATVPGRIETFRFGRLVDAKNIQQRIAGVTVTLQQVRKANVVQPPPAVGTAWEVSINVRFDDAGDALASHRQWIFSNPAYLEDREGKRLAYDTFETTAQDKNELGLAYLFRTDRPLADWTFVYRTPGTIVTRAFDYELKNLELP
jgi:hypothetical protein